MRLDFYVFEQLSRGTVPGSKICFAVRTWAMNFCFLDFGLDYRMTAELGT